MTLQELAQILGGIGVIASITYAAIQLRNNARALRAQTVQQLNLSIIALWDELARNREMTMTMLKGGDDFEQLDHWDKGRFRFFLLSRMRRYEVAHFQLLIGNITREDWDNIFSYEKVTFSRPGFIVAWGLIRTRFGPKFSAIIDAMVESENQKAKASAQPVAPPANPPKRKAKK